MPSRRSSSRAAAPRRSGEPPSNTPLVIALVFSILLAITLGVFLYLAQDKIATAQANEKKARDDADTAKKLFDIEDYKVKKLLAYIDPTTLGATDSDKVRDMDRSAQGLPAWFTQLRRKMEGDPSSPNPAEKSGELGPYDQGTGKTASSLIARLIEQRRQFNTTATQLANAQAQLAQLTDEFNKYKATWSATTFDQMFKEKSDKLEATHDAKVKELTRTIALQNQKIADLTKEVEKIYTDEQKKTADIEKQFKAKEDDLKKQVEDTLKEHEVRMRASQIIHFDEPRGRVVKTEPKGDTVYIDIGSDLKARPQLSFSVYGRGPGGQPLAEPKAIIEIISVAGRNASLARVTKVAKPPQARTGLDGSSDQYWITDPRNFWRSQDPIVPGDLLYNPVWDPHHKVHVALAGVFDLDGDGSDDVETFIRMLKEMGAEVDSYLDPRNDYSERGKIDYQTDFLVIGGMPAFGGEDAALISKAAAAAYNKISDETEKMQKEAQKRGVEIIGLKRFLTRMGYNAIRVPTAKAPAVTGAPVEATPKEAAPGVPADPTKVEPPKNGKN